MPGGTCLEGIQCLLLASSSFQLQGISTNEGGVTSAVTGYGAGFYLWLGSCAAPVVLSIVFDRLTRKARRRREHFDRLHGRRHRYRRAVELRDRIVDAMNGRPTAAGFAGAPSIAPEG